MAPTPPHPQEPIEVEAIPREVSAERLRRALRDGAATVFRRVLAMDIDAGPATRRMDPATTVTASVPIGGDVSGRLTLHLPLTTGDRVLLAMTGRRDPARAAMIDLAGELANMIAGAALGRLRCANAWLGCPRDVASDALARREGERVLLRLTSVCGEFWLEWRLASEASEPRIATRRVRARRREPQAETIS